MARLQKSKSIVIPKIIISIHTMQLGKVICFAFSDGTVQYRDRFTMEEIYNEHNVNSIMSPHQVGFRFENETPSKRTPVAILAYPTADAVCRPSSSFLPNKLLLRSNLRGWASQVEWHAISH
jgi:Mediator complex subunit 16